MNLVPRFLAASALALPLAVAVLAASLPAPKKTVAVVDFDNQSGNSKYDPSARASPP